MSNKKFLSLCLVPALAIAAAAVLASGPVFAAGPATMNGSNQKSDQSGAKGGGFSGWGDMRGEQAPSAHGGSVAANFDSEKGWGRGNINAQGPGGGSSDSNFEKNSDWK